MRIYICGDSTAASYPPEETEMVGSGGSADARRVRTEKRKQRKRRYGKSEK